ncbi:hypothetical protein FHL15_005870 [Xylaria flabelliformis]|uniref:Uncharacterized protein n=1 Tax=Xylaria flabelliformis TaxID=2512241 RepID=A0A553HZC4_9PEZI|nr:hypothetical protein FHL15_005870 [Xylaria flabelliformis]
MQQPELLIDLLLDKISERDEVDLFFHHKIRFNWNTATGKLVLLFMVHPIHDAFKVDFGTALDRELNRLAKTISPLRLFRENIRQRGHTFTRYNDHTNPLFVFNACRSHGDLRQAVAEYFKQFPGQLSTYLGFEIDYQERAIRDTSSCHSTALLYMWHMEWSESESCWAVKPILEGELFRDASGKAVAGRLDVPFRWLVPLSERTNLPQKAQDATLSFDFADLTAIINQGEKEHREFDSSPPPDSPLQSRKQKALIKFLSMDNSDEDAVAVAVKYIAA